MKNKIKLALVAAFSVASAVIVLIHSAPTAAAPSDEAASPRTLYVQNCARCHGSNGKAETALGRKLDAADLTGGRSIAGITRIVKSGKGKMLSFRKRLTAKQIADIAGYVHSL
jgi:mono/diheme cytochrome c family protein